MTLSERLLVNLYWRFSCAPRIQAADPRFTDGFIRHLTRVMLSHGLRRRAG